jgi:hypothetical protein
MCDEHLQLKGSKSNQTGLPPTRTVYIRKLNYQTLAKFVLTDRLVKLIIPSGGSLGSWVDEERSQLRNLMRIAYTLSIDILNAYCGFGNSNPKPRLFEGCTSKEVQLPCPSNWCATVCVL